jgi:hypothetical protein
LETIEKVFYCLLAKICGNMYQEPLGSLKYTRWGPARLPPARWLDLDPLDLTWPSSHLWEQLQEFETREVGPEYSSRSWHGEERVVGR